MPRAAQAADGARGALVKPIEPKDIHGAKLTVVDFGGAIGANIRPPAEARGRELVRERHARHSVGGGGGRAHRVGRVAAVSASGASTSPVSGRPNHIFMRRASSAWLARLRLLQIAMI